MLQAGQASLEVELGVRTAGQLPLISDRPRRQNHSVPAPDRGVPRPSPAVGVAARLDCRGIKIRIKNKLLPNSVVLSEHLQSIKMEQ